MSDSPDDLKDVPLTALFRLEAEQQLPRITDGLLALEGGDASQLEPMMRAAHSLKGAARIVGLDAAVRVAHAMEDCFVAVQRGELTLGQPQIDRLLVGVDLLTRITRTPDNEVGAWDAEKEPEVAAFIAELGAVLRAEFLAPAASSEPVPPTPAEKSAPPAAPAAPAARPPSTSRPEARVLRVTADNLNRLLALAGESLVESRRLRPFGASVARLKRLHRQLGHTLDQLGGQIDARATGAELKDHVAAARHELAAARDFLAERLVELDTYDRRATNLAHRLYGEALAVRMRPFADGLTGFPRMVRDLARELGKDVRLEVHGEDTQVDRDILEKLEAPLGHLLRNAIDHGIERPAERIAAGKPGTGTLRLEARHSAGVLLIRVSDDGRGLALDSVRSAIVRRKLVAPETVPRLSDAELLEFLFLPGFSLAETVTEISGRGVGLDVVQTMVKEVRGSVRAAAQPGHGMQFQLQLPLTLSVVRALLVEIGGEPYALPLGFIVRTLRMSEPDVTTTEGRQHFGFDGRRIGLVAAHQVLGRPAGARSRELSVVVLGEAARTYGVVVDRFLGESELVVQPLDPRLGKVPDIAAGALMADGSPVLIIDVADFVRSIEKISGRGALANVSGAADARAAAARKRVLVVDDSLTVRELERKLLESRDYAVEIAVDGADGWNAVRTGGFNLVITDVDMPRLDGIELTRLIKADARLRGVPVMIVSYKDRAEDRQRGLDAGADYYLTKGSFHDETMLDAVADLIGPAREVPA